MKLSMQQKVRAALGADPLVGRPTGVVPPPAPQPTAPTSPSTTTPGTLPTSSVSKVVNGGCYCPDPTGKKPYVSCACPQGIYYGLPDPSKAPAFLYMTQGVCYYNSGNPGQCPAGVYVQIPAPVNAPAVPAAPGSAATCAPPCTIVNGQCVCPPVTPTTDWTTYAGYGALALGGILLISALTKK